MTENKISIVDINLLPIALKAAGPQWFLTLGLSLFPNPKESTMR